MAKPTTELEQRCPSPPYTRWDQRGKPVLLSYLKPINGKRVCLSLETDDPDVARRHMRLLVAILLAKGRLSSDGRAAKVYGPKETGRSRLQKIEAEVRQLKAPSEAEYGSKALAAAKRWGCPVGIIHHLVERRPELSAGTYATRRMRARERGRVMPMGNTWEHRRQGGKCLFWNGKVLTARVQIGSRRWQWPLKGIDEENAEALMAPVRVARERLRRAAAEVLNCEFGTDAALAAGAARFAARGQLANAITTAGGPKKLVEFVLKGPQEAVGTDIPERLVISRAVRRAMKLAAQAPANDQVELVAAGQDPSMLNLSPKSVQDERRLPAPRFMQWARGRGGKLVLQCAVYLSDGSRLSCSLNTDDTKVLAPQRMRLLLSNAIAARQLPRGVKHAAWVLYGGPIPQVTKRLLTRLAALPWREYELQCPSASQRLGYHPPTIDWLTNQDKARQADPVRRARARTLARSRTRKVGRRTPISRAWQFGAVGGMLAVHPDGHPIYVQLTIAGFTLRWRLAVQNRFEADALVKPAVDARAHVREAARRWRECLIGSPEAKTALAGLLAEQGRFRKALLAVGAKRSRSWAEVDKALEEPPLDEGNTREGCARWFVELLQKNPERPPAGRPVEMLLKDADALFRVGGRGARRCYELAQEKTGNRNWSTTRRPRKSAP